MSFATRMVRFSRRLAVAVCLAAVAPAGFAATSEISVDIKTDSIDYVAGERIRAVVNVMNMSAGEIRVGTPKAPDRFILEVFRVNDKRQLAKLSKTPFVSPFILESCKSGKLEVFLGDHFGLRNPDHYFVRPVLIHAGLRYVGQQRAFDVVPGIRMGGALQLFKNREGLQRQFDIVRWSRRGQEHLFLTAQDLGTQKRKWFTTDLGGMMKITPPTVSVMPTGEIIVLHRFDPDNFIRSEFWSVPDALEFHRRELLQDPETAGTKRVGEIYKESGGIKPKENPWWKFW